MYKDERPKGVIVEVLDMSDLESEALAYRLKTHPDCFKAKIYGGETAIYKSKNGHLYSINTEGVGYNVSEEEPLEVQFHGSYYQREESTHEDLLGRNVLGPIKEGSHSFDMLPFASAILTSDKLKSYPVKEEVDLADFIRSFGQRLEDNFHSWFKILS